MIRDELDDHDGKLMQLVQKNVTVSETAWDRLRINAQQSGTPLCIFLTYLIQMSRPVTPDDVPGNRMLKELEEDRQRQAKRTLV